MLVSCCLGTYFLRVVDVRRAGTQVMWHIYLHISVQTANFLLALIGTLIFTIIQLDTANFGYCRGEMGVHAPAHSWDGCPAASIAQITTVVLKCHALIWSWYIFCQCLMKTRTSKWLWTRSWYNIVVVWGMCSLVPHLGSVTLVLGCWIARRPGYSIPHVTHLALQVLFAGNY